MLLRNMLKGVVLLVSAFAFIGLMAFTIPKLTPEPEWHAITLTEPIVVTALNDSHGIAFVSGRARRFNLEIGDHLAVSSRASRSVVSPRGRAVTYILGQLAGGTREEIP